MRTYGYSERYFLNESRPQWEIVLWEEWPKRNTDSLRTVQNTDYGHSISAYCHELWPTGQWRIGKMGQRSSFNIKFQPQSSREIIREISSVLWKLSVTVFLFFCQNVTLYSWERLKLRKTRTRKNYQPCRLRLLLNHKKTTILLYITLSHCSILLWQMVICNCKLETFYSSPRITIF